MTEAPDRARARGVVRDAISALQNLHALLRSPKVGPRAIAAVLPEIHDSLIPLGDAVENALRSARERGHGALAIDELVSSVRQSSSEMAGAVGAAIGRDVDARTRLTLEASVDRLAPGLDAARGLVDMLAAAEGDTPVSLEVADLIEEALAPASQRSAVWGAVLTVYVVLPSRQLSPLFVGPRGTIPLIHLAIAAVHAGAKGRSIVISAEETDAVVAVLVEARDAASIEPGADAIVLRAPVLIPPSFDIMALAGQLTGVKVFVDAVRPSARVEFAKAVA